MFRVSRGPGLRDLCGKLDLFRVFWSVQDKGGCEIVSANKQWKARPAFGI